ncbi:MAG: copper resistance protein B [Novosphingobium sp.]|nr:copper resistance protein B [Novosphingobium sp.]
MTARALFSAASLLGLSAPAWAQTMDHSAMPGMQMPASPAPTPAPATDPDCLPEHAAMGHCTPKVAQPAPAPVSAPVDPHAGHAAPAPRAAPPAAASPSCPPEHAAMGHCTATPAAPADASKPDDMAAMPGHDMSAMPGDAAAGGTALPAGDAPAPAAPEPTYADRIWGRDAMVGARRTLRREHGGGTFSLIMFNLAEVQLREGRDGYRWDGEGWFGGDINRLVIKSEGSGSFGEGPDDAEVQALYSRAIGPYFNLHAGLRHDFTPNPSRTYATVGFEGLAPYWFEVEGALFLSDKGDVLGRLEGYYDQRITQRLILQPRAELNLAAQDVPENGIGAGLSDIELGLRLRYEIAREFAPYVGVSWDRKLGDTADFARAAGEDPSSTSVVLGIRAWF